MIFCRRQNQCILTCLFTQALITLFYTVAPSGESFKPTLQHNSFIGICCTNENAEQLQVKSTGIHDFELDLFNEHARYVRHNTVTVLGLRFRGDAAIH